MRDFIILGTDTDVGKTTFALLWLTRWGQEYDYWKPVETGESDTARIGELSERVKVHPPAASFRAAVAPALAASLEGRSMPNALDLAAARPRSQSGRALLIETFGSPFSPLNDDELQLSLVHQLGEVCLLVSSSKLGGIGRTLQTLAALRTAAIEPFVVVLLGPRDAFTENQIERHLPGQSVVSIEPPQEWTREGFIRCTAEQEDALVHIHSLLPRYSLPQQSDALARLPSLLPEDRRCVWHPYTSLLDADEPLECVGAEHEFLMLANGRAVIDGISSWWTILHGHRDPLLVEALTQAAYQLDHVLFAGVTHPHAVELADLLLGTMPWFGGRVFYSDNGSTAVEVALKMAYQFWCHQGQPQRTRFVGFEHGYHGDTFGAMAVSRDPLFFGRFEPLLFQADILPLDPARLDEHLREHLIAAVILEPLMQGAGGMRMHSPALLRQIANITNKHGVLFIADEVMTGGGRTGTLWAHQAAGIVPDLVCAAKTLTGGILPLAATLVSPAIVEAFRTADRSRTFFHGHSFTANPLACAVAVCNYRLLLNQPPLAPSRMEAFWTRWLEPLRLHHRVKDVRIRGSIAAVEVDVPGGYLADAGRTMRRVCLERGVFLRPLGSVLYAMPPYCTSADSLQRIADAMLAAVRAL